MAGYKHTGTVTPGPMAAENLLFTHTVLSNIKAWLNGAHYGVSKKHLPCYLCEWNYHFNRCNGRALDWGFSDGW